jgi:hypothetical protein
MWKERAVCSPDVASPGTAANMKYAYVAVDVADDMISS